MNIVVCVKIVVSTEQLTRIEGGTSIDDRGLPHVVNMCDLVALEEALQLKEKAIATRVTTISMGTSSAKDGLYKSLAMGADKAILLCDSAFASSDSYATSVVLARAIESLDFGLVLCGKKSSDTGSGQVAYYLAEMLGVPVISAAVKLQIFPGEKVVVHRKLRAGFRDVLEAPLPAVVSVESGLNEPRYVSLRAISRAKGRDIIEYRAKDLGLSLENVGQSGSKTMVISISRPRPKKIFVPDKNLSAMERLFQVESGGIEEKKGRLLTGGPQEVASELVSILLSEKVIQI